MSKLITLCLAVVLIFGISIYIFQSAGGAGLKQQVRNGHASVTNQVRSFDYVTN
ncbi:hypothetical protein ACFCP7_13320 [Paenibacillus elgii]